MSGFTLYETLRILLPGVIGSSIVHVVWSVLTSLRENQNVASIPIPAVTDLLLVGLLFGLFLYVIDIPARFRILKEGDPPDYPVPAHSIGTIIGSEPASIRNLQLYWFLSDRYLPEEYHKRLYLAGALFKVFVDTRVLLIAATISLCIGGWILGPASWNTATKSACFSLLCLARWLLLPATVLTIGILGVLTYRLNVFQKRGEGPSEWIPKELREIRGVLMLLFLGGVLGVGLVLSGTWAVAGGLFLGLIGFGTWLAVEIGPPELTKDGGLQPLRSAYLQKLQSRHAGTQFSQFQRLWCDVALIWPWSWLALVAWLQLDVAYFFVSVMTMASLAAMILSLRKHESRFLAFYKEQAAWFELHKSDLLTISETGELPDHWE